MQTHKGLRVLSFISLICVLLGSSLIRIVAQNPSQPPAANKSAQKKSDQDTKPVGAHVGNSEAQPLDVSDETIKIDTGLVQLDVTVIDQTNTPISNLNKDNFTVYEDKVKQVIESVIREDGPISFGLVVDTSGSMRGKLRTVTDAAVTLLRRMRSDDEGFIAQFNYDTELVQGFTRDQLKLVKSLLQFDVTGSTALLDAIINTAEYTIKKGKLRRKALIIFSDGLERTSSVKENEVMQTIKENEVQLYLVGFIGEEISDSSYSNSENARAKELLERLAEDSGGRAFFPNNLDEIPAIAAQIAKDLRTQYIIRYYPSNEKNDGTFRRIGVVINSKDNRKLIARTRLGYYARNDKASAP